MCSARGLRQHRRCGPRPRRRIRQGHDFLLPAAFNRLTVSAPGRVSLPRRVDPRANKPRWRHKAPVASTRRRHRSSITGLREGCRTPWASRRARTPPRPSNPPSFRQRASPGEASHPRQPGRSGRPPIRLTATRTAPIESGPIRSLPIQSPGIRSQPNRWRPVTTAQHRRRSPSRHSVVRADQSGLDSLRPHQPRRVRPPRPLLRHSPPPRPSRSGQARPMSRQHLSRQNLSRQA